MTPQQIAVVQMLAQAALETVREAGKQGAPSGPMYAAFMQYGMSLEQYTALMGALVRAGKLKQRGNVYFAA